MTEAPKKHGRPAKAKTDATRSAIGALGALETHEGSLGRETIDELRVARQSRLKLLGNGAPQRVEILSAVRSAYVESGRDKYLDVQLNAFLEMIFTELEGGFAPGAAMFVTGESGAGKTRSVRAMLDRCPALRAETHSFGTQLPWVSITLGGSSTIKMLGHKILEAAGYPLKETSSSKVWHILPDILSMKRIFLVHIDETQHLVRETEKDRDRKDLTDAIKGCMTNSIWPISFILSGLPQTNNIASLDAQLDRRSVKVHLPPLKTDDREIVVKIVEAQTKVAGLSSENLLLTDLPERLMHAADAQFGRVCDATLAAIRDALSRDQKRLELQNYRRAFDLSSHSLGSPEKNPFATEHWRDLPKGSFIIGKIYDQSRPDEDDVE